MKNPLRMTHFAECRHCIALKTYPLNLQRSKRKMRYFLCPIPSIWITFIEFFVSTRFLSLFASVFLVLSLNLITYISYLKSSEIEKRTKSKKSHIKTMVESENVYFTEEKKNEIEWHFENLIIIVLQWVTIHLSCNLALTTIARCYMLACCCCSIGSRCNSRISSTCRKSVSHNGRNAD